MAREIQTIRNGAGKLLGRLYEDSSSQDQELRNGTGVLVGRYTKSNNSTRTGTGRLAGYGNILLTLI